MHYFKLISHHILLPIIKHHYFFLLILLFLNNQSFACLNGDSKSLTNGRLLYYDFETNVPDGHDLNNKDLVEGLREMDSLYTIYNEIEYLSDKGVLLILMGKYEEAIEIYLEIEKIEPNRYSTASNLGTAYELIGQNEEALKWIKKSVEIDPNSHHRSEWIHVNILEAKIKGEEFYTANFLIDTEFGNQNFPISELSKGELNGLERALFYQLNERITFVKPKDKIVAELLFELGNVALLLGNYYDALKDYHKAANYGFYSPLLEKRIAYTENKIKSNRLQHVQNDIDAEKQLYFWLYFVGIVFFVLFGFMIYKRTR